MHQRNKILAAFNVLTFDKIYLMRLKLISILFFIIFFSAFSNAQSPCGSTVPTFTVNLTGTPAGSWTSPPQVYRNGSCCGDGNCVYFIVTLDPGAAGIIFNIIDGAVPGGALYYQVNCGPQTTLGLPICVSGVGPHKITFCKPGGNPNQYQITSIPGAVVGANISVNDGCTGTMNASGFNISTATWNSIYPGALGAYNNYLSCTTGCQNPTITATGTIPPYVDYQICGSPASVCNFTAVCDTVRVSFPTTLLVNITPPNPTICLGQTSIMITANGSGGTPPYTYLWNNVNPAQSILVGNGTYTVKLSDASNCPPAYATVTVTSFSVAISANAGTDKIVCKQNPITTINGSVVGATGGIWSGGGGTFSPNNTTLLGSTYSPTPAQLTAGFADLTLTTTGNGSCPAGSDIVRINYVVFNGTVSFTTTPVSCSGGNDGTATVSVAAGIPPYTPNTYSWNTSPAQTAITATNLSMGTYSVTITNSMGCTTTNPVTITQPPPLALASSITHVVCNGGSNGSISITPTGGNGAYIYLWSPGNQTTSSISSQPAGAYTVTVKDSKLCQIISTYTITQPALIVVVITPTPVSCFNGSNGTANSTVSGGTFPYTYNWNSGATSPNVPGLLAGSVTLTVTDVFGCIGANSVTITQPTSYTVSTTSTNETCNYSNDGTATASASGGTPGYTYLWSNGSTNSLISNLTSQIYSITATDLNGCTAIAFATITEPPLLTINFISQINVSCFGGNNGSVTASPSGGTASYTYLWSNGATTSQISNLTSQNYSVTVTDSKGCVATNSVTIIQPTLLTAGTTITNETCFTSNNGTATAVPAGGTSSYTYLWQPGLQTTATISNLSAGSYTVTITDTKGCIATANAVITQPPLLAVSFTSQTNVNCFAGSDGAVMASPSGGTPGYSYLWSNLSGFENLTGLAAGTYSVTVTDNAGCFLTNSVIITQPTVLTANTTVTNETCNQLNNGTAAVIVSGGTSPYTYLWSNLSGFQNLTGLAAGIYTVTSTDSRGCTATASVTITEPATLAVNFNSQTNVSCFGGNDGIVATTPSGGTPNYTYLWSNAATTSLISNLTSQNYTVTVTDANGCTTTNSVTITQPLTPLVVSASSLPVSCYGSANGSVSSSATGGTGPYTYIWMPGSLSGQNILNLAAGTYSVTASDSKGCVISNSVTVTQPSQLVITTSSVNADCGQPNGQSSVSVTGGNSPYFYLWSPSGGTAATATGLISGIYTILVTDVTGCTASQFRNVNDNSAPTVTIFSIVHVSCNGGSTGSAQVSTVGGIGPFTYIWMPSGGTDSIATGLAAGSYTVTVTGANGCQSFATTSPDISEPPPILIALTQTTVSCFGGTDGTASVIASGGTTGYTYQWLPGLTTGTSITNLSATTYTINVTDANSCLKTMPFTITQPSAPLSVSLSFTPVSCFGGSNGSVAALAAGGTAPYNYNWMPGNFNGPSLSNLAQGTYTVTVTDSKGCTLINNSITVTQPTLIVLTTNSINSNCSFANGQASVVASGGTGSYLYQWLPSGGSNAVATALSTGSYSVTVTDANGCVSTLGTTVNNNASPIATVSSTTNVTCYGGSDGTATASVAGGTGPFTYLWLPSGGTNSIATGLLLGTYTVTVTDANLCPSSAVTSPPINQPNPILITVTQTNVTCFGNTDGTASAIASSGTPSYTYQWLPSGTPGTSIANLSVTTYTIEVTDANSCVQTMPVIINGTGLLTAVISPVSNVSCMGGNNGTAIATVSGGTIGYTYNWLPLGGNGSTGTGLSAGTYTVTVTDINNCIASNSVTITQPLQALSASGTGFSTSCFGGSNGTAGINTIGGTPAYSYLWNPAVSTSDTAFGLSPGNYTVLVTDNNGCQTNTSLSIVQPSAISGTLVTINPSCGLPNGSISTQLSGGVSPYTYLWSPGAATTSAINGLGTGVYNLIVTDASNCTESFSATLSVMPFPIIGVSSINNVSCNGGNDGSATINVSSGTPPYIINWLPSGGNGLTATVLSAGTYTMNVTDAIGCQAIDSLIIGEPTPVTVSISSINDVLCNGGNTGSISVAASGGTGPLYTYTWAPGGSGSSTASNLTIGTYTVNVMDQNNCVKAISVGIAQPTLLTASVDTVIHAVCYNGFGSATVLASGGTIPYSYSWSAPAVGQTGNEVNNLSAASYTVTVTDTNGCFTSVNLIIKQPLQVITQAGLNDTLCFGQTGSVSATATGGSGNYYYAWQPSGAITSGALPITPTSSTTYTVVAFDQIGCPGTPETVTAIVYNLTATNVQAFATSPICPGQSSTIYVETSGTTGPLTFQWNNNLGTGPGAFLVTVFQPTTYIVTVSNSCGLSVTDSAVVLFNPQPTFSLTSNPNSICVPGFIAFSSNAVPGDPNDPITLWNWDFGDGISSNAEDPVHFYSTPGTYFVILTVSTNGGCTSNNLSVPLTISAYPNPTAAFSVNATNLNLPYDVLILNNQSTGANSYYWEFGDAGTSTLFSPQYVYTSIGVFQVQLITMNQYGCADTAFAEVTTDADVIFPNVFTPNPNGTQGGAYDINNLNNDIFFPYSSGVIEFKVEIFNRWGEEIFESLDIKQGWDGYYRGAICQQDVYVWKAKIKLNNGKMFNKNGDVTLLRY